MGPHTAVVLEGVLKAVHRDTAKGHHGHWQEALGQCQKVQASAASGPQGSWPGASRPPAEGAATRRQQPATVALRAPRPVVARHQVDQGQRKARYPHLPADTGSSAGALLWPCT